MAKGIYMTVYNVLRKVPGVYMTVDSAVRKVPAGYMTVNNVVRQFHPQIWWDCDTRVYDTGEYTGTYTINSASAGLEDSGSYVMRVNATFSKSTDDLRIQAICRLYAPFNTGDDVTVKWTATKCATYIDKGIYFHTEDGTELDGDALSYTATSGTHTATIPEGTAYIRFYLSVGKSGTNDMYFSLNSLTVGDTTYI